MYFFNKRIKHFKWLFHDLQIKKSHITYKDSSYIYIIIKIISWFLKLWYFVLYSKFSFLFFFFWVFIPLFIYLILGCFIIFLSYKSFVPKNSPKQKAKKKKKSASQITIILILIIYWYNNVSTKLMLIFLYIKSNVEFTIFSQQILESNLFLVT